MSFLKSLFGGGEKKAAAPQVDAHEEHEGYTIKAVLMHSGGEFQLAGTIEKEVDGELKIYKYVRADKFASKEDAIVATLSKGRQLIKEQGKTLFR